MNYIATATITRHNEGVSSKVTLVKDEEYTEEQLAAMPCWYREYTRLSD